MPAFHFQKFSIEQAGVVHPVGTDGVLLGAWANIENAQTILDIGTGTGIIALMLAQRTESVAAHITGIEMHPDTHQCARMNSLQSPWHDRLDMQCSSVQAFSQNTDNQYDIIISNPPFFSEEVVSPDARRRMGRHVGTLMPEELIVAVKKMLAPKGRFYLILPEKEGRFFCELAATKGLYYTKLTEVTGREGKPVERLLLEMRREPHCLERDAFCIYEATGRYSDRYKLLTKDFYLPK